VSAEKILEEYKRDVAHSRRDGLISGLDTAIKKIKETYVPELSATSAEMQQIILDILEKERYRLQ
jgi:hypothetical protein